MPPSPPAGRLQTWGEARAALAAGAGQGGSLARLGLREAGLRCDQGSAGSVKKEVWSVVQRRYGFLVARLGLGGSVLPLQLTELCVFSRSNGFSEPQWSHL